VTVKTIKSKVAGKSKSMGFFGNRYVLKTCWSQKVRDLGIRSIGWVNAEIGRSNNIFSCTRCCDYCLISHNNMQK